MNEKIKMIRLNLRINTCNNYRKLHGKPMRREKSLRKIREQKLKKIKKWYVKVWKVYECSFNPQPFVDTIFDTLKNEEMAAKLLEKENKEKRQKLMAIKAQKEDEALMNMSLEEIDKEIEKLR